MKKRDRIKAELEAIRTKSNGVLHPENVVRFARNNTRSALHSQFEWNSTKAAHQYRLWQARHLIQIVIVDAGGEAELVSLSIDRAAAGGYRAITDVLNSRQLSAVMLGDAIAELERVKGRYQRIAALTSIWKELDAVKRKASRRKK